MCQKQCRDQNGFKCHVNSEAHIRQMEVFSENAPQILANNSTAFENEFLTLLKCKYGQRRVLANDVYTEFISDRYHLHMNSTRWETLTQFVRYLGQSGKCIIDNTEKGWYIQYVNNDPVKLATKELEEERKKDELKEEERNMKKMKKRIEYLKSVEEKNKKNEINNNKPKEVIDGPIKIELKQTKKLAIINEDNEIDDNENNEVFL